ncbi:unnamed protein product [Withania somnifera]
MSTCNVPIPSRQLYIDGEWRESVKKDRITIINPATEQIIGAQRTKYIRAIAAKVLERKSELESLDSGKTSCFEYYADLAEALDSKRKSPVHLHLDSCKTCVLREPLGVVGLITPCLELAEICREVGLPPGALNILTGLGPESGAPLASHPHVDKISFTGSIPTGVKIVTAAAQLVKESVAPAFLDRLPLWTKKIKISDPLEEDCKLGPIASSGQHLTKGCYVQPTIITDVNTLMEIWKEEVFEPVLCVKTFKTEEEAIELANDTNYGLASAIMSKDAERCERFTKAFQTGIIWVNCSQPTFHQLPWGGKKRSAFGRDLGEWGLQKYLNIKQVTEYTSDDAWGFFKSASN